MSLQQPPRLVSESGIRVRRASSVVVGRSIELGAVEEVVAAARGEISGISFEGEPGIGKTRLLFSAAESAVAHGFVPVQVSADEELHGPFMLARGLLASENLRDGATAPVVAALDRARDAIAGRPDPALDGLAPEAKLLRVIDQASLAIRAAAIERPLALMLDDVQWADQDSLRLLRYLVRTQLSLPIFLALALRTEESGSASELVTLLADIDRMGILKRIRVPRFRQSDTAEFLRHLLDGPVSHPAVVAIHGQAEGVPFVIEELTRTYRDAGLLTIVDRSWTIAPKAARLVPSSVKTLVQRRAARLPDQTKATMADAAVLGRRFRASDVCAIRVQLGEPECTPTAVVDALAPAVDAGLLGFSPDGPGPEFTFSHQLVHDFAIGLLAPARRRGIHGAIVDLIASDDRPAGPGSMASLALHAIAAGDTERAARYSIQAAGDALKSNAPDEALRLIDEALAIVSDMRGRVALLRIRDDALDVLRRVDDRLQGLTELAALAEASGDRGLQAEVKLRRAAALRLDGQSDTALTLARQVADDAAARADRPQELAAQIEIGQVLLGATLGEGYAPTPLESDFDGAEAAYSRARDLAEATGDRRRLAAVTRELGVIVSARVREWFIEAIKRGEHIGIIEHVAAGGRLEDVLVTLPVMPQYNEAIGLFKRALELYEEVGDRRGAMSTVIAMAYAAWAPDLHVGSSPALRFEEIRRLSTSLQSLSKESERDAADLQMAYGVHVFSRAKVIPDLALVRGREAVDRARLVGDRGLEFMALVGMAATNIDLGDMASARRCLDRAGSIAASSPTPLRTRELELRRGLLAAAEGDVAGLRQHMEQALDVAVRHDRRVARCEILAAYALACVALAEVRGGDPDLLAEAENRATEARAIAAELPGRPPWDAQAESALASVAFQRGAIDEALRHARAALASRRDAAREDPHLETLLPAARVILAAGDPGEQQQVADELQRLQGLIGQRTVDDAVRAAWFRGPVGSPLTALTGSAGGAVAETPDSSEVVDDAAAAEQRLLGMLVEGRTNTEIAAILGTSVDAVGHSLAEMYARIGAASRTEATVMAVTGSV